MWQVREKERKERINEEVKEIKGRKETVEVKETGMRERNGRKKGKGKGKRDWERTKDAKN